jgi:2-polyprenyl-3-methyl-5-hydroxy-6-metoxy-1,4-benzoquinol methylase
VCGHQYHNSVYKGPIRAGSKDHFNEMGEIVSCKSCNVTRLLEQYCMADDKYQSDEYRYAMGQGVSTADFYEQADSNQLLNLSAFWPYTLRGKSVVDIGCGAGSFLDNIRGMASKIVAIEPTPLYHKDLVLKGYEHFSSTLAALKVYSENFDCAFTFQVIEHVSDPVKFISEIRNLIKPGGKIILSTPNKNDVLTSLMPETFMPFYYRSAHRWYFDNKTIVEVLERAGFKDIEVKFQHSFGIANMVNWALSKKPKGNSQIKCLNNVADELWKGYLESTGQTDTIYAIAIKE